ncbi:MAG: anhydro-N-acetylmuramic acid kinase [Alphaproteobacteria bacterium]|nr:anhydro-N-acetylmuramic acid kinase [Alphaproteobacteria bacterium]
MIAAMASETAPPSKPSRSIGLMTGTVLDGEIDIALLQTDGETIEAFGPATAARYATKTVALLQDALAAAQNWRFSGPEPAVFSEAERALTEAQSNAVLEFLTDNALTPSEIDCIGFHGQTVLHRAPTAERKGATRQLGDGALMARLTGIDTVNDFRSADVAAGGNGAPLAPIYHAALLDRIGAGPETAMLNLGGVGNLTWRGADGAMIAFDTGPANAPINDWVARHGLGAMDRDGALAATGHINEARLTACLAHPYFAAPPPKSLDRNDFTAALAEGLSPEDGAATLTTLAAASVARGLAHLPAAPRRLIVSGGGAHNPALMRALGSRTGAEAVAADAIGLQGDAVEAACFAFLAVRALRGLPISFPGTTGVPAPMSGGVLHRASEGGDPG